MKKCPDGKILNPATNRCVKKDGKIGKKLLAQAAKKSVAKKPAPKKPAAKKPAAKKPAAKKPAAKKPACSKLKKTKDPKCEDVEGCEWVIRVGCRKRRHSPVHHEESKSKSMVKSKSKSMVKSMASEEYKSNAETVSRSRAKAVPGTPGIPTEFKGLVEDCKQNDKWIKSQLLGSGEYGDVFLACRKSDPTDCEYALKVQGNELEFQMETMALNELQGISGIPKMYAAWTCKGTGYIVMQALEPCRITEKTRSAFKKVLKDALKKGWLHVDSHHQNVMCDDTGKVYVMDWGLAAPKNMATFDLHVLADYPEYRKGEKLTFDDLLEYQNKKVKSWDKYLKIPAK